MSESKKKIYKYKMLTAFKNGLARQCINSETDPMTEDEFVEILKTSIKEMKPAWWHVRKANNSLYKRLEAIK